MMVKFFRIEVGGHGAYGCYFGGNAQVESSAKSPSPYEDTMLKEFWHNTEDRLPYYFGFESEEDMFSWFPKERIRSTLDELFEWNRDDVEVCVYEADQQHVRFGSTQLVFKKKHATCLSRTPILQFIEENVT